ncbi:MAG TPA: hypothetical protein VE981_21180 [Planctomycetota bacterium]|nr:hypothetical protein [Planctomycetota bacterium]
MSVILDFLCCAAFQESEPFESRQPKFRERLLQEGGGSGESDAAVTRALRWLLKTQKPDGSWAVPEEDYAVGVTGLAVLAFLGAGHSPKSEEYGPTIPSALRFLISAQDSEGCVGPRGEKHLYGHAVATAAFAEALALGGTNDDAARVRKAVDFLVGAQNPGKGWRYAAKCGDNDTSVTAWAVQALWSAEQAGLTFPKAAYDGALAWIDQVTDASGRVRCIPNPHRMIPGRDEMLDPHETPTAMAMISRYRMSKVRKESRLAAGTLLLGKDLPRWERDSVDFCYWHFGSIAQFRIEGPAGETWKAWNAALLPALLKHQVDAGEHQGSWDPVDRWSTHVPRRFYATAMNAMTLETCYRYGQFSGDRDR